MKVGKAIRTGVGVTVGVGVGVGVAVGIGVGVGVAVGAGAGVGVAVGAGVGVESSPHARAVDSSMGSRIRSRVRFISMVLQESALSSRFTRTTKLYHAKSPRKQPMSCHAYGIYLKGNYIER